MVLSYIYMKHYSINLCGVEDSVENFKHIWFHDVRLWCSSPVASFFFQFVIRISISFMIVMLNYAFTHMPFSLRILHLAVAGFSIASQKTAATDPI